MCGIFGVASLNLENIRLEEMTDTLSHRGPNDSGFYRDQFVALGQRRLSIIDLEGGHQPIFNEDGSMCIVFNGEVFNFQELTEDLERKGHVFSTRSDTETLLHAYEEYGEKCVERFRGMFSFAIWDSRNRTLFIARDRLGIKPLFHAEHGGRFYFASEMKAILEEAAFPREMDETAVASYFTLSYIPAPFTIFKNIRKLLPGHTLTWKAGEITIRKYWDLFFAPDWTKREDYFLEGFLDILRESVKLRLISDVPLGAFLSGGIDSSTVVALMSEFSSDPVNTFCIGFNGETGGYLDERGYARSVASRYGTNHDEYAVFPDPRGLIETIVRAFDEPFADDSTIPSYFVCKRAREKVTVALSGLGGDEVFAGYERYVGFYLRGLYSKIPRFLRRGLISPLVGSLPERADGHYTVNHMKRFVRSDSSSAGASYLGFLSIISPSLRGSIFSDPAGLSDPFKTCEDLVLGYFNSPNVSDDGFSSINRAFYCDFKTYLPDDILALTDRISMKHSLEVRVPFTDHKLVEFCATIPPEIKMKWGRKKYLLKKGVSNLLPPEVLNHRKQGFVGPMTRWLQTDLKDYVEHCLSNANLAKHGMFKPDGVKHVLAQHFAGKEIHDTFIWALVTFQTWFETYIWRH